MVVILNTHGVIAANFANMCQRHLSEQYRSQVNIQDFGKLNKRIFLSVKDTLYAFEVVKNIMITFDFQQDDITAVKRVSKWCENDIDQLIKMFECSENY